MKQRSAPLFGILALLLLFGIPVSAQKMKPEEVIAKHLDSFAPADKRAAFKTFIAVGDVKVTNVTRKNPPAIGRIVLASSGTKTFAGMNLNSNDNPVEKILFDGRKSRVDFTLPGTRSLLGTLLQSNTPMIEQGIYHGILTSNWALFDAIGQRGKLSWDGSKKIDGVETVSLGFAPKGGSDFGVTLYFDSATFRHVRTEYKRTSSAQIGTRPEQSSGFSETRIRIIEDYSDFKAVDGYTVPHKYRMIYTISGQNGTQEVKWEYDLLEVAVNRPMDDATFSLEQK